MANEIIVIRYVLKAKQQLCVLLPGLITTKVKFALIVDCSDTARSQKKQIKGHKEEKVANSFYSLCF
jgi:hypothetical protein